MIEEIGKADASTGWVVNQAGIYATYAARMPRAAARAIWMDPPRIVSNTPAASAQAVVVPGGYRVTGRQGFSTGCRNAAWVAAHAQVIDNGAVRLDNGQPETRYCYVPVAEAELLDTWQVRGMRGTGTHHFAVKDVFVPAERTVLSVTAPLIETNPALPHPAHLLFASGDASVALGTARACLTAFFELAGAKTPRASRGSLRDQPMVQADASGEAGHAPLGAGAPDGGDGELWAAATGPGLTLEQRATMRIATTHAIRQAVQVVDIVYNAAGATSVYESRASSSATSGRARDEPAHAVALLALRAGRPPLARAAHRRGAPVVTTTLITGGRAHRRAALAAQLLTRASAWCCSTPRRPARAWRRSRATATAWRSCAATCSRSPSSPARCARIARRRSSTWRSCSAARATRPRSAPRGSTSSAP